VPFGPGDPTVPTPSWPAYRSFAQGDCSALRAYLGTSDGGGLGDFGKAMAAVCAAAVDGDQRQWEVAAAAYSSSDSSSLGNDCLAGVVKGVLDRALAWHQGHPSGKPEVRFERVDGQTECGAAASTDATEPTDTTDTTEPTETTETTETTESTESTVSTDPTETT
jgi:hypothetical protein